MGQGSAPLLQQCAANELPQLTEAFHFSLASIGVTLARLGDDFVQYASILAAAGIETKEALEETGLRRLCQLGVSADHANCMSRSAPQELCSLCCREPSMNLLKICDNSGNLLCFNCAEQRPNCVDDFQSKVDSGVFDELFDVEVTKFPTRRGPLHVLLCCCRVQHIPPSLLPQNLLKFVAKAQQGSLIRHPLAVAAQCHQLVCRCQFVQP